MTVYADVLLVVNLFVNYALLMCASLIMKNSTSRRRVLLGAAVGSIYGLVIFLPELPNIAELALRLAASCLIVFCAFGFKNIRYYLRCFFTFFAVSFAFGGIMLVLWVTVAPVGMVYNNGAVYFDINLAVLAVSTVVCFAVVSLISHFASRRAPRNSVFTVKITLGGESVSGTALSDTGNSLHESFSGYPVMIGEFESLKKILPTEIVEYINEPMNISSSTNLRLVPHRTVSGTGLLPAFRPDCVEIKSIGKTIKTDKVFIAVTKNNIARGEYDFILNPALVCEEKNYDETAEKNKGALVKTQK